MTYYDILGINPDSDQDTIKRAYRKKAMQYHPDRNPDDKQAEKKFNKIRHIYEVLSDPQRRERYDARFIKTANGTVANTRVRRSEADPEDLVTQTHQENGDHPSESPTPSSASPRQRVVWTQVVTRGSWVIMLAMILIVLVFWLDKKRVNLQPNKPRSAQSGQPQGKVVLKNPQTRGDKPRSAQSGQAQGKVILEHPQTRGDKLRSAQSGQPQGKVVLEHPQSESVKEFPSVETPKELVSPTSSFPTTKSESKEGTRTVRTIDHPIVGRMVLIPAGEFLMGSEKTDRQANSNEFPQHKVRVEEPFYMGAFEVTRDQFFGFISATGYLTEAERDGVGGWGYDRKTRRFARSGNRYSWTYTGFVQNDKHPVVNVSWNDATAFCRWVSDSDGKHKFRLPTEAEWEYACRANTTTEYFFGNDQTSLQTNENIGDRSLVRSLARGGGGLSLIQQAAPWDDGISFTTEVGRFGFNGFGLYDMHGNVSEWVGDWYRPYEPDQIQNSSVTNAGNERVFRGGNWGYGPKNSRSATRHHFSPSDRWCNLGFRIVCDEIQRGN